MDRQIPLALGFPQQEYWSGLPFSSPGDLPEPGIEPTFPLLVSHQGSSKKLQEYSGVKLEISFPFHFVSLLFMC